METDEPQSNVALPSQPRQFVGTTEMAGSSASVPQHIHYHFHTHQHPAPSLPSAVSFGEASVHSEPERLHLADLAIVDDDSLGIGAATSNLSLNSSSSSSIPREPSIDNRMELLLASRHSLQRQIRNDELPVLSFPYFDPAKLKPIDFSLPVPVGDIVLFNTTTSSLASGSSGESSEDSQPQQLQLLPLSHGRRQMRLARKRFLFRIGLRNSFTEVRNFMSAVNQGDLVKVSGLLHEGVNPNACDQKRRTPLHVAVSRGHFAIAHLLLAHKADPKMRDILGNTPLHLAVCYGDRRVVRLLIENGASIHIKDNNGRTPLSIVKSRLNTLRGDRSVSTDTLKGEFMLMADFLQHHEKRLQAEAAPAPVEDLCRLMEGVSTREQADEIADAMISKMSSLCIENQTRQTPICHPIL
ncbi:ankyrin repeat domain-containing protein 54 isoform X2 [Aplysia californica]|uniref:Ankyrin repeat domain-containing protein 54 isoform X2 n=1 Tax=Aplysia californica TaxID=6500 RepID=A0ABM0K2R4_APLCA|nr:ankyrin repeat domain-containing protein 54 isoform X2 [Aplysia californica]